MRWTLTSALAVMAAVIIPSSVVVVSGQDQVNMQGVILGYYASWKAASYSPDSIPWLYLTHVNYAFGVPDVNGNLIIDNPNLLTTFVNTAHHYGRKACLSIGGWAGSAHFSDILKDQAKTTTFYSGIYAALKTYNLDGIDIDWEFPGDSDGALGNSADSAHDTDNYATFLQTVRSVIGSQYLITAAVRYRIWQKNGQSLPDLTPFAVSLNWVNVMIYDFWGRWSPTAGHSAPLVTPSVPAFQSSFQSSLQLWTQARMPVSKLVMGAPLYGHSWVITQRPITSFGYLNTANGSVQGDVDDQPDETGFYTGVWKWKNIRKNLDVDFIAGINGWQRYKDLVAQAPYLFNPSTNQWISYDDPESVTAKAQYVNQVGALGIMFWDLEEDGDSSDLVAAASNALFSSTYCPSNNKHRRSLMDTLTDLFAEPMTLKAVPTAATAGKFYKRQYVDANAQGTANHGGLAPVIASSGTLGCEARCTKTVQVGAGGGCQAIASAAFPTLSQQQALDQLKLYNPGVGADCRLQVSQYLCVQWANVTCASELVVQANQGCWTIGRDVLGDSVSGVTQISTFLNQEVNCARIQPGDHLCKAAGSPCVPSPNAKYTSIPTPVIVGPNPQATQVPLPEPNALASQLPCIKRCTRTYTVQVGDTCSYIASSMTVNGQPISVQDIERSNLASNNLCSTLQPNQVICLNMQDARCNTGYTVQSGDTLYSISGTKLGDTTNFNALLSNFYNDFGGCKYLYQGQVICLQAGKSCTQSGTDLALAIIPQCPAGAIPAVSPVIPGSIVRCKPPGENLPLNGAGLSTGSGSAGSADGMSEILIIGICVGLGVAVLVVVSGVLIWRSRKNNRFTQFTQFTQFFDKTHMTNPNAKGMWQSGLGDTSDISKTNYMNDGGFMPPGSNMYQQQGFDPNGMQQQFTDPNGMQQQFSDPNMQQPYSTGGYGDQQQQGFYPQDPNAMYAQPGQDMYGGGDPNFVQPPPDMYNQGQMQMDPYNQGGFADPYGQVAMPDAARLQ